VPAAPGPSASHRLTHTCTRHSTAQHSVTPGHAGHQSRALILCRSRSYGLHITHTPTHPPIHISSTYPPPPTHTFQVQQLGQYTCRSTLLRETFKSLPAPSPLGWSQQVLLGSVEPCQAVSLPPACFILKSPPPPLHPPPTHPHLPPPPSPPHPHPPTPALDPPPLTPPPQVVSAVLFRNPFDCLLVLSPYCAMSIPNAITVSTHAFTS
jgi:hypothetical protein